MRSSLYKWTIGILSTHWYIFDLCSATWLLLWGKCTQKLYGEIPFDKRAWATMQIKFCFTHIHRPNMPIIYVSLISRVSVLILLFKSLHQILQLAWFLISSVKHHYTEIAGTLWSGQAQEFENQIRYAYINYENIFVSQNLYDMDLNCVFKSLITFTPCRHKFDHFINEILNLSLFSKSI